mmetsp:Transcript_73189/g.169785  ORF Transcript_73189/g.169785 Transcript_73189/m.169785 type:complete len:256 (-) Transcript_73189:262-1029(-)
MQVPLLLLLWFHVGRKTRGCIGTPRSEHGDEGKEPEEPEQAQQGSVLRLASRGFKVDAQRRVDRQFVLQEGPEDHDIQDVKPQGVHESQVSWGYMDKRNIPPGERHNGNRNPAQEVARSSDRGPGRLVHFMPVDKATSPRRVIALRNAVTNGRRLVGAGAVAVHTAQEGFREAGDCGDCPTHRMEQGNVHHELNGCAEHVECREQSVLGGAWQSQRADEEAQQQAEQEAGPSKAGDPPRDDHSRDGLVRCPSAGT